jgi:uncharacterized protein YsxB (DUF464 family)
VGHTSSGSSIANAFVICAGLSAIITGVGLWFGKAGKMKIYGKFEDYIENENGKR